MINIPSPSIFNANIGLISLLGGFRASRGRTSCWTVWEETPSLDEDKTGEIFSLVLWPRPGPPRTVTGFASGYFASCISFRRFRCSARSRTVNLSLAITSGQFSCTVRHTSRPGSRPQGSRKDCQQDAGKLFKQRSMGEQ